MLEPDRDGFYRVGAHSLRKVGDDVILSRAVGDVVLAEALVIMEIIRSFPAPEKGFFYISNVSQLGRQMRDATEATESFPREKFRMLLVVGAAFRHRVALDVMMRVSRFFGRSFLETPIEHFTTEEEALAYCDKARRGEAAPQPLQA